MLQTGVARSPEYAQLRADVFGRRVLACAEPDVSLYGAGALAAVGARVHPDLAAAAGAMAPEVRTFEPDAGRAARYADLFEEWRRLRARAAAG